MRRTKQILYGGIFLLVIGLILWGISAVFFSAPPSCFDNKKNQEETGVDCGGPCVSCAIKSLKNLELSSARIFLVQDSIGAAVEIYNPNSAFAAANFRYRMEIKDEFGAALRIVEGEYFAYAGELSHIVIPYLEGGLKNAAQISVIFSDVSWVPRGDFLRPEIETREIKTEKRSGSPVVSGKAINQSPSNFSQVAIMAFLFNKGGRLLSASRTSLDTLEKFSTRDFIITFSGGRDILEPAPPLPSFPRNILLGDSGSDVKILQGILLENGLLTRQISGFFDEATEQALRSFQKKYELKETGILDEETRVFIFALLGGSQPVPEDENELIDPAQTKVFIEARRW